MISPRIRTVILRAYFESVDAHAVAFCARHAGADGITADKVEEIWAEEFNAHPFVREMGPRPKLGYPEGDKRTLARRFYA